MLKARFGGSFSVENGRVVAVDAAGNRIMSASGLEEATFDEALAKIVREYPGADKITRRGGGNGANRTRTITRSAWERLPPSEQHAALVVQKLTLVD